GSTPSTAVSTRCARSSSASPPETPTSREPSPRSSANSTAPRARRRAGRARRRRDGVPRRSGRWRRRARRSLAATYTPPASIWASPFSRRSPCDELPRPPSPASPELAGRLRGGRRKARASSLRRLRRRTRLAAQILLRPGQLLELRLDRRAQRPVRVVEVGSRQRAEVGPASGEDRVHLVRCGDVADGDRGDLCLVANLVGKARLPDRKSTRLNSS